MIYNPLIFSNHHYYDRRLYRNKYLNNYTNQYSNENFNNYQNNLPKNYYTSYYKVSNSCSSENTSQPHLEKKIQNKKEEYTEPELFEIFGIRLYFDDILLICLIFFLYNEGVKDQYLFISLILLLLS